MYLYLDCMYILTQSWLGHRKTTEHFIETTHAVSGGFPSYCLVSSGGFLLEPWRDWTLTCHRFSRWITVDCLRKDIVRATFRQHKVSGQIRILFHIHPTKLLATPSWILRLYTELAQQTVCSATIEEWTLADWSSIIAQLELQVNRFPDQVSHREP